MAHDNSRIAIDPALNSVLEALAKARRTSKRNLVEQMLRRSLENDDRLSAVVGMLKAAAERQMSVDAKIEVIASVVSDIWSAEKGPAE
ncbi:hypothetical protein VW35_16465 [Devosia soli]|uniref:Ribbon-helix-helix protein CopG domain-containing protein n=1 Tax=Devosia soli TaxID=361041 RepID=A0A0F5L3F9_9HYPH|nr:hypothetical protein [Devosia soli]KKB76903.1 hypothetical protein VW35_16465 [Devosia soli]